MTLSKHANVRCQQRGIPDEIVQLIHNFGDMNYCPGHAYKEFIPKKEREELISSLKKIINWIEKSKNVTLVVRDDDYVITAYHNKKG